MNEKLEQVLNTAKSSSIYAWIKREIIDKNRHPAIIAVLWVAYWAVDCMNPVIGFKGVSFFYYGIFPPLAVFGAIAIKNSKSSF